MFILLNLLGKLWRLSAVFFNMALCEPKVVKELLSFINHIMDAYVQFLREI